MGVDDCAMGFMRDLLDDAVIDYAEDLVHELDNACLSPMNDKTLQSLSQPEIVENVAEPMITESEEEADDSWAAATVITEVAAEQALHNAEKDSSQETESTADTLQMSTADTLQTPDEYEEVYTWEGADAEAQGESCEIEATVYAEMAASIAKTALDKSCEPEKPQAKAEESEHQAVIQDSAQSKDEVAHDFVCGLLDHAIGGAALTAWQAADGADDVVDEPAPPVRRQLEDHVVVESPACQLPENTENEVETLRLHARQTLLEAATDGRLERCIPKKTNPEKWPLVSLKNDLRKSLSEAARSGHLTNVFSKLNREKQAKELERTAGEALEPLKMTLRKNLAEAAFTGRLKSMLSKLSLKKQAAKTNECPQVRAASPHASWGSVPLGTWLKTLSFEAKAISPEAQQPTAKSISASIEDPEAVSADGARELQLAARETLLGALESGRLESAFAVAKKASEKKTLQLQARKTLLQAIESGRFKDAVETANKSKEVARLKHTAVQVLNKGAESGSLDAALADVAKARQIAEVRRLARETLFGAATSGELEEVCAKIDQKEKLKQVKGKAKDALAKALVNIESEREVINERPKQPMVQELKEIAEIEEIEEIKETPKTLQMSARSSTPASSKMKRRIIGGVTRQPKQRDELSKSPSPEHGRRARHAKKEHKEDKYSFRQSGNTDLDLSTCAKAFGAPAFDCPPSSRTSARLRKAVSMSALAMDLGADAVPAAPTVAPPPPMYPAPSMLSSRSAAPSPFGQTSFAPVPLQSARSSSLASLRVSKSKASGLLPSLPSKQSSTESIEWSMGISKSSLKWSTIDLRGTRTRF